VVLLAVQGLAIVVVLVLCAPSTGVKGQEADA
jgi:hypothetical protein